MTYKYKLRRVEYLLTNELIHTPLGSVSCEFKGSKLVIILGGEPMISFEIDDDPLLISLNVTHGNCDGFGIMDLNWINDVIEKIDVIKDIITNDEDYEDFD